MPLQSTSGAATYDAFGAPAASAVTQAEAIDFDGTNDYLRRTSDLTGNTTSKTFTFSAWIWQGDTATSYFYVVSDGTNQRFVVRVVSGTLSVEGTNTSNAVILQVTCDLTAVSRTATFYHVLISMNMANAANRSIYINDIAQSLTVTTYTNAAIPFNQVDHVVAGVQGGGARDKGRLSNVFLDYTYRDLSITANRRLFVTADLKPAAGQAALNPILYLPMSDPTQPGLNQGTGGNFTLNGVVARSGRGPNQYNAPYSDLNTSTNSLSRTTALTGIADGRQFSMSFCFNKDGTSQECVFFIGSSTSRRFRAFINTPGQLLIDANQSGGGDVLVVTSAAGSIVPNRNYVVTVSVDLTSTSKRHLYINGSAATATWSTYTNDDIDFSPATPRYYVGYDAGRLDFYDGRIGALWFNTSYIDLSQPANLAKFVTGTGIDAKPVDLGATGELPTGTSPLIYLPMYGNNPGKNYGTGGDFTSSGGFPSAGRGPNEFWGNKADFNGTTGYLSKLTSLSGVSNSKTVSLSFWVSFDTGTSYATVFFLGVSSGGVNLWVNRDGANTLNIYGVDATGATCLDVSSSFTLSTGTPYFVQFSADLSNSSKRALVINGTVNSATWRTYSNAALNLTTDTLNFGRAHTGGMYLDGKIAEFYLTTDYIDFTQEANRLKFRDCFGNPTDLPSAITAVSIPTPAIYLRFPPTSFGTNSGTGGNFTVNGTITDGGQL